MAGGKKAATALCYKTRDRVIVRGLDLCRDLIGKVGFTEFFLFLLTGERPTPALVKLVEASMVAIAEHGLVPSVQAARMTLHAAPDALQGAVAAGLLGAGSVMFGTSENAGRVLADIAASVASGDKPLEQAVFEKLTAIRQAKEPLPGFGHRTHSNGDPRATRLLEYADELGVSGVHCRALREMANQVEKVFGRKLLPNIQSAIPAVLLDGGFPADVLRGVPIVARAAGLIAHLAEESRRPIASALWYTAEAAIDYDGTPAS
ncbi:MAG: citryl-CoA lyase [Betaproteobacteria bacterium]|nr:citryl-CoA lyase [Betaproteobacteria bacterium]MBI2960825.1 citryl-CoA lyase [Betaproteobacteria bacterium]